MKTKTSATRGIVLAALFLALAFVLPMITGHVPQVGNMLCPMHFPILLCGFVLGGPWGLAVGFVAPMLRSVLFGMPPMFPVAISMAFELATYGFVSGVVYRRVQHTLPMMFATLLSAMVAGRLVWGPVHPGRAHRFQFPVLSIPVRRAPYRRARHPCPAHSDPAHRQRTDQGKADRLIFYSTKGLTHEVPALFSCF